MPSHAQIAIPDRQEALMPELTDTQTLVLSRAATRPGNLALPLPKGLFGAAAKMAVTKMIERGWLGFSFSDAEDEETPVERSSY